MSRLCLITALPAESRPWLTALKLRQEPSTYWRLYGSDDFLLLETGPGKLTAAAATGAVLGSCSGIGAVVNIGIAGGMFDVGSVVIAHHIRDHASGTQWFPHLPSTVQFRNTASARVDTLDSPGTHYRHNVLFDMEASGIFSAASRYLSTSHLHCIKVVSDNPHHGIEKISKDSVLQVMQQALPTIIPLLDGLREQMAAQLTTTTTDAEAVVRQAKANTHHSVNDERQLRQLVLQYLALTGKPPTLHATGSSAAQIRRELRSELQAQPLLYRDH